MRAARVDSFSSPFEGLAERMNWCEATLEEDRFGAGLLAAGIPKATIVEWCGDPQVQGKSLFDSLEDLDADVCLTTAVELAGKAR